MSLFSLCKSELAGLFELLFPQACPLCRNELTTPSPNGLCSICLEQLPPLAAPNCLRCALPFETVDGSDHHCETCLRQEPPFRRVQAVGSYTGLLREAVHRFKFENAVHFDRTFGLLLAQRMEQTEIPFRPDLIVPVPLHLSRLRQRGYNQSLLLARQLGKHWRIPVVPRLLVRTRPTPSQQGLTAAVRQENLRGAFALLQPLQGETILLVDDVLTTGATARACAQLLRAGGAAEVEVAVIGRALRHH